ncbi:MAG: caspase family protein [Chitinophagaceae bacterium]
MKKLPILIFLLIAVNKLPAQEKYAIIFSRLATVSGIENIMARNNINIIKNGLLSQEFKPTKIIIDSTLSSRAFFLNTIQKVTENLRKGDFVFLYFDLPFGIEPGTPKNDLVLKLNFRNAKEFVTIGELQKLLSSVVRKVSDPHLFFTLFDNDFISEKDVNERTTNGFAEITGDSTSSFFPFQPGQQNYIKENASIFARAVASALLLTTKNNSTNIDFFKNIEKYILFSTSNQFPVAVIPASNSPLFNGNYVKYPPHLVIDEKINETTFSINAGKRNNISVGSQVKFYKSFSDTSIGSFIADGIVTSTTAVTSIVSIQGKSKSNIADAWVYVTKINMASINPVISFNETYSGDEKTKNDFLLVLEQLKKRQNATYCKFIKKGGDLQINNIVHLSKDSLELVLNNPQTGEIYKSLFIKGNDDLSELVKLCKNMAQYEYMSRLTNYIPDLAVDFKITDKKGMPAKNKENGYDILYEGDKMIINISNPNSKKLYFALIDLTQDKNYNIIGFREEESMIMPNETLKIDIIISLPFGKERIKILTSYLPINLNALREESTRAAKYAMNFSDINIQDYDFEARSILFSKEADHANRLQVKVETDKLTNRNNYIVNNKSSDKIYFNVLKQQEDGVYQFIFPNKELKEANCYVNSNNNDVFSFNNRLNEYDQLITIYADRPFNLDKFIGEGIQINNLLSDIIRYGRISGGPLNKIGLLQELYRPEKTMAMRDGDNVFIKLITPKISSERGIIIEAESQQYDINGFAMSADNKPIKEMKINGQSVNYDPSLKFFENTIQLTVGVNKVVIEAIDEKGFTATRTINLELKNDNSVISAGPGKNYFLGIGIDNYETWPVLNNAKNDVIRFSNLLKQKFGFDSIKLILDKDATRGKIINGIRDFLKKAGPNDNIVIYLSGHGNEDQLADGAYYFIPQEADADDVTSAVKSTDIIDNFAKIKAKRCLLIVDACYSGMITNSVNKNSSAITSSTDEQVAENSPTKWIITSGRATKVSDGEKGKNSPFATVLINYLSDHDDAASLKMTRLLDFLIDKVKLLNKQQEPLGVPIEGRGELLFKVVEKKKN